MVRYFHLEFPREIVTRPVVSEAIRETGASINILRARIDETHGEMIADVSGEDSVVARFIEFLKNKGVGVERLMDTVSVEVDGCIHCGACISVCPVGAIRMTRSFEVAFDKDRCISCKVCVPVCPVGAIKAPPI